MNKCVIYTPCITSLSLSLSHHIEWPCTFGVSNFHIVHFKFCAYTRKKERCVTPSNRALHHNGCCCAFNGHYLKSALFVLKFSKPLIRPQSFFLCRCSAFWKMLFLTFAQLNLNSSLCIFFESYVCTTTTHQNPISENENKINKLLCMRSIVIFALIHNVVCAHGTRVRNGKKQNCIFNIVAHKMVPKALT